MSHKLHSSSKQNLQINIIFLVGIISWSNKIEMFESGWKKMLQMFITNIRSREKTIFFAFVIICCEIRFFESLSVIKLLHLKFQRLNLFQREQLKNFWKLSSMWIVCVDNLGNKSSFWTIWIWNLYITRCKCIMNCTYLSLMNSKIIYLSTGHEHKTDWLNKVPTTKNRQVRILQWFCWNINIYWNIISCNWNNFLWSWACPTDTAAFSCYSQASTSLSHPLIFPYSQLATP